MPPKKGIRREKPVFVKPPDFSSDDEAEIPEIKEEGDEHRGEKHQEYSSQPDGSDKKKQDLKKGKEESSDSKASPSTSKTLIHAQELADKADIKSLVPRWTDPKFWVPILGVVQIITIIAGVYVCVSLESRIKDSKSCRKGDTAVDSSQSCADCMCVATEGFSSKEFSNIMQSQRKTEEKYMLLENSVKEVQGKLSENDYKSFGFKNKVLDIEREMSKLNEKFVQFNSNSIIGMEDFIAMFEREWGKREKISMKDFDSRKSSLKGDLDKEVEEIKVNVKKKPDQFQSKIDQQWQENIQRIVVIEEQLKTFKNKNAEVLESIKEKMKLFDNKFEGVHAPLIFFFQEIYGLKQWETFKYRTAQDMESIKEKMKFFDKKFDGVHGQLNFFFQEIYGLNNYILAVLLVVVIGVIIVAYKSLISRRGPYDTSRYPVETSKKPDSGQKTIESMTSVTAKLKRKGLKNGTLIISFHPSTQQFHQNLLIAVSVSNKSTPLNVVIQSSDDLMNVEPQKQVIIFVDFNDQNIILENEETNLRNQTTKVFMSLGCDVFVVYCKDKGSRDLQQDNLYNANLTSIDRHPVLSELKNKNRVLSINDKFHPNQVEHLKSSFQQW